MASTFHEVRAKFAHRVSTQANRLCESERMAQYERKKAEWIQANPNAAAREYEQAMTRIAAEVGV